MYKIPKIVTLSRSEDRWVFGVRKGSIEASDEHLIGTRLGAVEASDVTALPDGQSFEVKAIDEMEGTPWRPSTEHQGTSVRTHIADEEEQDNAGEEEPEEIQMDILDKEEPGKTAEEVVKKQDVFPAESDSHTISPSRHWTTPWLPRMQVHHW